ncbi:MAG: hypothetical protein RSE91_00185 [Bacilli bacterium]
MKNSFSSYMKFGASVITGLVLMYASFFLFSNYYHYEALKNTVNIKVGDTISYQKASEKLVTLKNNLNFNLDKDTKKTNVNFVQTLQGHLSICQREISDSFSKYKDINEITYKVVDDMRTDYFVKTVNECAITQLYFLIDYDTSTLPPATSLNTIKPFIKNGIYQIKNRNSFLTKSYLNNSSISFSTVTARTTIHDPIADGYDEVITSYNDAIDFFVTISEWLRNEAEIK